MKILKFILPFTVFCIILSACSQDKNVESSEYDSFGETSQAITSIEESIVTDDETTTEETVTEAPVLNPLSTDRCLFGADTGSSLTATGFEPLEPFDFRLTQYIDTGDCSLEMQSHGYGVATDEKPHTVSITNQQIFDEKGYDAVCLDTESEKKVLYLTFDCGYENGYTAMILDVLKEKNVPAAFFCTLPQMRDNHEIISRMITEGHIVGNHSVTHPDFSTLSGEEIVSEIKGFDDYIRENFGYSSLYFRYPQGKYSDYSMRAVNELGFRCVFWSLAYADWDIENQKGADYALETVMSRIHPGAVILLHAVSPDNANALSDIIDSAREKGYEFRSLEDM